MRVYCVGVTTEFDSSYFRAVLGHVPTSVVVVTGLDHDDKPHGITIGSFASISLDPPLVGFFPGSQSRSWAAIAGTGKFCVNVLSGDQEELCWRFAKEGEDKFDGLDWSRSEAGLPLLPNVVASIDCRVESDSEVGDHHFVVGQVTSLSHADDVTDAMVFFRGKVSRAIYPGPST